MAVGASGAKVDASAKVGSWPEGTAIRFSGSKREGSAAQQRYAKYSKATTVGEALRLGAKRGDLRWDYSHGLLRRLGRPPKLGKAPEKAKGRNASRKRAEAVKARAKAAAASSVAKKREKGGTKMVKEEKHADAQNAAAGEDAKEAAGEAAGEAAVPGMPGFKPKGTCYQPETYMVVTRWMAETRIEYKPHAKREGSKSFVRYESYSQAKTVGESLALGSFPQDWCWDYERGFIKVLGPVRDEPLDISTIFDKSQLSDVDLQVGRWFKREAARMLGVSLKQMAEDKGWHESILQKIKRSVAENKAISILQEVQSTGRKVNDADVLKILQQWGFRMNVTRENVMPEGVKAINSDTLGLIPSRDGRIIATRETLDYPNVVRLLTRWFKDHMPADLPMEFPFTSINVNKNYAARLHRDGNNVGPSMIKAFGSFTGGALNYWPDDDKKTSLEELPSKPSVSVNLSDGLALFDGRRGHSVDAFEGERYSLVYFTCARYSKSDPVLKQQMIDRGICWPTKASAAFAMQALVPPSGYGAGATASLDSKGKLKYWPLAPVEDQSRGTKRSLAGSGGTLKAVPTPMGRKAARR